MFLMKSFYDAIYLSPHLDDVALSCGGQIFAATAVHKSILIVTIMAGEPSEGIVSDYIDALHDRWQLAADAVTARRQEDVTASRILGADYVHWDIPDCIYRLHPVDGTPMYLSDDDIFAAVHPAEAGLVEQLAPRIAALPNCNRIVAPLTVGHHVDHQLVRQAVEQLYGRSGSDQLIYYEEYPYAADPGVLETVIPPQHPDWREEVIPVREVDLAARIDAVAAFTSQLSTFFNGRSDLERQIKQYVQQVGGERLWQHINGINTPLS